MVKRIAGRRAFMGGMAALGTCGLAARAMGADLSNTIVLRDPGGSFRAGWTQAFYEPFTRETGINVLPVTSSAEPTAEILMMVQDRSYLWDIAGAMTGTALQKLVDNNAVERHGLDHDPAVSTIPPQYRTEYGIGSDVYSTVCAWRTDRWLGHRPPHGWQDFWDTTRYPGARGLRRDPMDMLELALMGDGVDPAHLYPLDLDRAFRCLDRIRAHVMAWWSSGAQGTNMIASAEVDMVPIWNARAAIAAHAGAPVGISWEGNIWGVDYWMILRGGPKVDLCRRFLSFVSDARRQAAWTRFLANGPVIPEAYDHIDPSIAITLPTYPSNHEKGVMTNSLYWVRNRDMVMERFLEWLAS
ncbi:extracellular solute-binding protein [Komagataeibacter swingsii]|uniref:Dehydrogenase n=1 Tax=Komagataeibacter swingsii TaxID=215220 RepID=A0A2V4RDV0_9PROT|nr:extracellular solute-binding protein [Komagataeibacter swingsii]PYD68196.1 dehydrogenase [Komagataeibacter swingsii]GBQ57520.1 spermidine/putrescine-binding periplasmic protein [Komagataeibacter swingsii DSM 16373]